MPGLGKTMWPAVAAMTAQAAWLGAQVIVTPVVLAASGEAGYGVYSAMIAGLALVMAMDLGLGNAVVTHAARADGSLVSGSALLGPARRRLRRLSIAVGTLGLALVGTGQLWGEAFEGVALFGWVLIAGAASLPFSLAPRIRLAIGQVPASSAWAVVGAGVGVILAVITARSDGGPVLCFLAVAFGRLLGLLGDWYTLPAGWRGRSLGRAPDVAGLLLKDGWQFWSLQLAAAFSYNIDVIIVGMLVGASEAGILSIVLRVLMLVPLFAGVALQPSWRTFARTSDAQMLMRHLVRSTLTVTLVAGCALGVLVIARDAVLILWLGAEAPQILDSIWIAVAVWALMATVTGPVAVLLNARRVLRPQLAVAVLATMLNLSLSCLLAVRLGAVGPVYASIAVQGLLVWPASLLMVRRAIRGVE